MGCVAVTDITQPIEPLPQKKRLTPFEADEKRKRQRDAQEKDIQAENSTSFYESLSDSSADTYEDSEPSEDICRRERPVGIRSRSPQDLFCPSDGSLQGFKDFGLFPNLRMGNRSMADLPLLGPESPRSNIASLTTEVGSSQATWGDVGMISAQSTDVEAGSDGEGSMDSYNELEVIHHTTQPSPLPTRSEDGGEESDGVVPDPKPAMASREYKKSLKVGILKRSKLSDMFPAEADACQLYDESACSSQLVEPSAC